MKLHEMMIVQSYLPNSGYSLNILIPDSEVDLRMVLKEWLYGPSTVVSMAVGIEVKLFHVGIHRSVRSNVLFETIQRSDLDL
jgi:hypothetical protein